MNMRPDISVIVPVFNITNLYEDKCLCFESLIHQTIPLSQLEIVAVDDKSSDNSVDILKKYKRNYPELFNLVLNEENTRDASIAGMANTHGEYVAFLDQDDWLSLDCLEKMLNLAHEKNADMVCCDYYTTYEQNYNPTNEISFFNIDTGIMDENKYRKMLVNCGHITGKLFRKSCFMENGKIKDFFSEQTNCSYGDNCKCPSIVFSMKSVEYVREPLYYYYRNKFSVTGHFDKRIFADRLNSSRIMLKRMDGYLQTYYPEIEYLFVHIFYVNSLMGLPIKNFSLLSYSISTAKQIRDETYEHFPNFKENKYYQERVSRGNKFFVNIQTKSNIAFFVLYFLYLVLRKCKNTVIKRKQAI